jgi:putative Holliday junction resolvase
MTDRPSSGSADGPGEDAPGATPSERPTLPHTGPLLAIDVGEKRIGLALSDPSQRVAHPLGTLQRRSGKRFPLAALREYLERDAPTGILIGLPLAPDGSEDERAHAAREVGARIAEKTGLPVDFRDERMTTARALRAVRELGGGLRNRKADVDPLAATTLLQSYLDSRR